MAVLKILLVFLGITLTVSVAESLSTHDRYGKSLKSIPATYIVANNQTNSYRVRRSAVDFVNRGEDSRDVDKELVKLIKSAMALYMAQDCRPAQYSGWEQFPVQSCHIL